ncbi:cyclic lactone autoinducer peptide [Clostridium brassicae]|uniref:Cyclic lactone autoinducer peptide n=1 Tax=Clostridium brassicae TaxID=2999072 RepID=A0ABT4DHQ9_9CLOT|nr:cyclic lactone autoinducer peptide [Clostridium brassicae]MCY6960631.1 cyclic lactone autoinducer peptide [Clostridium brassicae]
MKKLLNLMADFFRAFAFSTSASACLFSSYQPEEPKCLREE